jgi:Ca2+-binding RTX toxin-like protein
MKQLNSSERFALARPIRRAAVAIVAAAAVAVGFGIAADRAAAAVTASFSPTTGVLTVLGDSLNNVTTISRDAAGKILVNGGAVAIVGGTPTVANTVTIQVFGQGGDDTITLSEVNGALPRANLFGGAGNDTLTGGSGGDMLFGQSGNDTLLGKGGFDFLFGGADNDTETGGDADDQTFGESGNDRMIWNPGDDTDLNQGGDGLDTVEVNGGNGAEQFTTTPNGTRVRFDRVFPAPFSIDIGTSENLVLNANGGVDSFTGANGLAPLIKLSIDGGAGDDTITGGDGADVVLGGDGNDGVSGARGNDIALLGAGDDTASWNPGDGNDTIEGQAGSDTLQFNGSNISESLDLSANGNRLRLTRNIANIVMDLNDVEHVQLSGRGGADLTTVNDLAGTDVANVNVDLSVGGVGDGAADTIVVVGTLAEDTVTINRPAATPDPSVLGLSPFVSTTGFEPANDRITVNSLDGDDVVQVSETNGAIEGVFLNGGAGDDALVGGSGADNLAGDAGNDVLLGKGGGDSIGGGDGVDNITAGDGNDSVSGGPGADAASLRAGNDTFSWNPGDGNDVVGAQDGTDTLVLSGASVAENFGLSANSDRLRLTSDVANVVMDVGGVENVRLQALGGADTITVYNLKGTGVTAVKADLGLADGAADRVIVNGTGGVDTIAVAGSAAGIDVTGLAAAVGIAGAEAANDRLDVNTLAGIDAVNVAGGAQSLIQLFVDGVHI